MPARSSCCAFVSLPLPKEDPYFPSSCNYKATSFEILIASFLKIFVD
ncbi:unnamed protein product [Amoebophrya sp. A120]|nr:unnamed protein product [Amoebophrya sp. A120]|eukprot:GSA120T00025052001.1